MGSQWDQHTDSCKTVRKLFDSIKNNFLNVIIMCSEFDALFLGEKNLKYRSEVLSWHIGGTHLQPEYMILFWALCG